MADLTSLDLLSRTAGQKGAKVSSRVSERMEGNRSKGLEEIRMRKTPLKALKRLLSEQVRQANDAGEIAWPIPFIEVLSALLGPSPSPFQPRTARILSRASMPTLCGR